MKTKIKTDWRWIIGAFLFWAVVFLTVVIMVPKDNNRSRSGRKEFPPLNEYEKGEVIQKWEDSEKKFHDLNHFFRQLYAGKAAYADSIVLLSHRNQNNWVGGYMVDMENSSSRKAGILLCKAEINYYKKIIQEEKYFDSTDLYLFKVYINLYNKYGGSGKKLIIKYPPRIRVDRTYPKKIWQPVYCFYTFHPISPLSVF